MHSRSASILLASVSLLPASETLALQLLFCSTDRYFERRSAELSFMEYAGLLEKGKTLLYKNLRMWRNWYTRTFEGRVALPCEFESRHPHFEP
jgi:hypothetical protein